MNNTLRSTGAVVTAVGPGLMAPTAQAEEEEVVLDPAGAITAASTARSSGHPDLDQAGLDMLRRASPVPKPPRGVARTLTVPVRFSLR